MLNYYYGSNQNIPCLVALLWGNTDPGFNIRKLNRATAIEKYGYNTLLTLARPQDKPHINKYMCNIEFTKHITQENEKRKQIRYDFVKIANKYNIPLDIVKSFCKQYISYIE